VRRHSSPFDVTGSFSSKSWDSWLRLYGFRRSTANSASWSVRSNMQVPVFSKGLAMARGRWIGLLAVLLLIAAGAWGVLSQRAESSLNPEGLAQKKRAGAPLSSEDLAKHNRAVAHMNRNEIADAEAI